MERKLIWSYFFDCKVIVVCENEEIAKNFTQKMDRYKSFSDGKEFDFKCERYNFRFKEDRYNFWCQKKGLEFNVNDYEFAHWDAVMRYDEEMRKKYNK